MKIKLLTPKDIVSAGVGGIEHVLGLIHDGELEASNVSRSSSRPRWVITEAALEVFLKRRSNQQRGGQKPAQRRPKPRREYV